jgi:hypothetical protein
MLFRETVAVYCENHMEHTNTLCGQNGKSFPMIQQVVHTVTALNNPLEVAQMFVGPMQYNFYN